MLPGLIQSGPCASIAQAGAGKVEVWVVVSAARVVVEVSLTQALQEQLQEGDILFVFARADDGLPIPVD